MVLYHMLYSGGEEDGGELDGRGKCRIKKNFENEIAM